MLTFTQNMRSSSVQAKSLIYLSLSYLQNSLLQAETLWCKLLENTCFGFPLPLERCMCAWGQNLSITIHCFWHILFKKKILFLCCHLDRWGKLLYFRRLWKWWTICMVFIRWTFSTDDSSLFYNVSIELWYEWYHKQSRDYLASPRTVLLPTSPQILNYSGYCAIYFLGMM